MARKRSREEWEEIWGTIREAITEGKVEATITAAADYVGVPYGTLQGALRRELGVSAADLEEIANPKKAVKQEMKTNSWEITSNHPAIHTLAQLLEYCQVDLKVWEVERHVINSWPTAAKKREVDLQYEVQEDAKGNPKTVKHGKIKSDGKLTAKTNIQVKAWLRRKELRKLYPTLQPIELTVPALKAVRRKKNGIRRGLLVADVHVGFKRNIHDGQLLPFHDRRVLDVALQLAEYQAFDDVTFLGDSLDLSEWSTKFAVLPEFAYTTMPALIELQWWLGQFRSAAPKAEISLLEGNHDDRPRRAILSHFRAAYDLRPADELELPASLSVERLLSLHKLKVGYVRDYPDGKKWMTDQLMYQHGNQVRSGAGDTAKAVARKYAVTVCFGHVHRQELVTVTEHGQDRWLVQTFCPGCACHLDGRVPGSSEDGQWQQGLGIVEYWPEKPEVPVNIVPLLVDKGRAIYDGKVFEARDREVEIEDILAEKMALLAANSEGNH